MGVHMGIVIPRYIVWNGCVDVSRVVNCQLRGWHARYLREWMLMLVG